MTVAAKNIDLVSRLFMVDEAEQVRDATLHDHPHDTAAEREDGRLLAWPWTAIPLLADGRPDWDDRVSGDSLVVNSKGVWLECDLPKWCSAPAFIIGVQDPQSRTHYAGIQVCHTSHPAPGRVRMSGRFGGLGQQLLDPANLTPKFQPDSLTFALRLPQDVLDAWAKVGVLRAALLDRVQLCPRCHALPTFRTGCQCCGSARVTSDQLIHHFTCAHVGFVADFEAEGELICPKCRLRNLVVGSDYEYCTGPYRCLDCHWTAGELEQVGQCLRCELRFPGHQAHQRELTGYQVDRLDVPALLGSRLVADPTTAPAPAGQGHPPLAGMGAQR